MAKPPELGVLSVVWLRLLLRSQTYATVTGIESSSARCAQPHIP
ncbi:hypothetical protein [Leptolyngbya ectocarpi]|nr:hypothetical protein [Leptolyngbya ectocarpi]